MRSFSAAVAAALGLGASGLVIAACGDLFHGTNWTTACDQDAAAPGCGAGGGAASSSHATTASASSSSAASGGQGGSGGSGGSGGAGGDPCPAYCDAVDAACQGTHQQYTDKVSCEHVCALLPHTPGANANDIPCRTDEAAQAASQQALCPAAGPGGAGHCGADCDAYCTIMVARCPSVFMGIAACADACTTIDDTVAYDTSVQTGDNLACRLYWATVAVDDAQSCARAAPNSTVCVAMTGG
ncbi:MAG TPA: hypothetical protein VHB21_23165 [Minicystis sp.]|nr:hypothetical protein [Minicystis sp.]